MSLYNIFVENVVLPGSDLLLRQSISKHFRFLEESSKWTLSELHNYQDEKLRALIKYAVNQVPYYNHLFRKHKLSISDIKSRDDLYKIPLLTKSDIKKHFPDSIVSSDYPKKRTVFHKSSGSTGEPMQYLVSNDAYSFNIACTLRGWYWMGFRMGDRMVKVSQYDRSRTKRIQDVALRTKYLSSADLSNEGLKKLANAIIKYQPKVIRCYPDPLFFLSKYLDKNDIDSIQPDIITTTGNVLRPDVRQTVESFFGVKLFDSYKCEGGANFFEDPAHKVYINAMEYGISEIIADGEEVAPGERGRHITTDLHNYAMPFIRYDSQDILLRSSVPGSNGMAHQTIERVEGRDSDILITKSGKYLIVIHFVDYFDKFSSVNQFQVRQSTPEAIEILLTVNNAFRESHYKEIYHYWSDYIGDETSLTLTLVDSIPQNPSGKRRFLIRDKAINLGF